MSPDDHARQLIADSDNWIVEQGKRDGVPVGFTWAQLVRTDEEDLDQAPVDRANGKVFEALLTKWAGEDEDGTHWNYVGGYLVVKILDEQGQVTKIGRKAAETMCGLADYPVLSDETLSEIEQEGTERDWEQIEGEFAGGFLNANGAGQLDLGDGLSQKQIDKIYDEYDQHEPETLYDDRGYAFVNRELLWKVVSELGYVVPEDNPCAPGSAEAGASLGLSRDPHHQAVLDYLDAPSLDTWRWIRNVQFGPEPRLRLYHWVWRVDPSFPRDDDGTAAAPFPAPFTVARALKAAADAS